MLQLSEGKFSLEASFWFAESDFVFWLPSHLRAWFLCCDSGPGSLTFWAQTQKWWTWKSPTMAACLQNSNTWYEGGAWVSVSWGVRKREREVGGRGASHDTGVPCLSYRPWESKDVVTGAEPIVTWVLLRMGATWEGRLWWGENKSLPVAQN